VICNLYSIDIQPASWPSIRVFDRKVGRLGLNFKLGHTEDFINGFCFFYAKYLALIDCADDKVTVSG